MVAAARDPRLAAAVVIGGTDAQADPWVAGQRTQVTHDGRRPEGATELRKARREVGHLDDAILVVVEAGHQHGGIAAIGLLGALEILGLAIVEAIGRASGRESVCQDVWILVVSWTLKKKIKKNNMRRIM